MKRLLWSAVAAVVCVGCGDDGRPLAEAPPGARQVSTFVATNPAAFEFPDGVELTASGDVIASFPFLSEFRTYDRASGRELERIPFPAPAAGIWVDGDRVFAAAPGVIADGENFDPVEDADRQAVWSLAEDGTASLLAQLPVEATFPQNVAVLPNGTVVVSDSFGRIFSVADGEARVWSESPLLEGDATLPGPADRFPVPIGANGMDVRDGALYVSVTDFGRIVRIPIANDGSAGDPTVFAEDDALFGIASIEFGADSSRFYAVLPFRNIVLEAQLDDEGSLSIRILADGEDGLAGPSHAILSDDGRELFVANFAFVTDGSTEVTPGIIRVEL